MKLSVPFCGGSSASAASPKASNKSKSVKRSKDGKKSGGGGSSFNITSASSHVCTPVVTTPRTMLLPSSPPQGVAMASSRKPPALAPVVTREELEVALRQVVSSKEELAEILAEVDGGIVADVVAVEGDEGDLREAFAVFDADGDGRISAEELHIVLASLGDDLYSVDDCRRMISGIDVDGDGFVCFDEFSHMMMHGL